MEMFEPPFTIFEVIDEAKNMFVVYRRNAFATAMFRKRTINYTRST
ncbi:hypothetical protein VAEKB19_520004 [Vibrio aestuarianus]|nr:hypothetical protein VAEKB19_520004 [Vibrio aestuarianus]